MQVDRFDFALPPHLIAMRPAEPREAARLLHVGAAGLAHHHVGALPSLLQPGDLLLLNDTRVLPARLSALRGDVRISLQLHRSTAPDCWQAFAKPGKRLRLGDTLRIVVTAPDVPGSAAEAAIEAITAEVIGKDERGLVTLAFDRSGDALLRAFADLGAMPIPHYLGRAPDDRDRSDYQSIFAARDGAVAAPTASLHFTRDLMETLSARGVRTTTVTLHVGAGTFLPVKTEDTDDHQMLPEWGDVSAAAIDAIHATRAAGGAVVSVGTTPLRLIEQVARDGALRPFEGEVDLFITPGFRFRVVDRLVTNFHLPRSTLFMLVAAFAGLDMMHAAYREAIARGYRFYSYGDASLIDRQGDSAPA